MKPFPIEGEHILRKNVRTYARLTEPEQRKLRSDLQVLVAEKNWEGCGGLVITDEIKVTTAAQVCLLVLAMEDEYFDLVQSILVYPDAYVAAGRVITRGGVVLEGDSFREGEAWYRGPVVLSWADALAGGRQQSRGDNLVLHEFAHQLDRIRGSRLDSDWSSQVMSCAFSAFADLPHVIQPINDEWYYRRIGCQARSI